jgi:hypothetical protein
MSMSAHSAPESRVQRTNSTAAAGPYSSTPVRSTHGAPRRTPRGNGTHRNRARRTCLKSETQSSRHFRLQHGTGHDLNLGRSRSQHGTGHDLNLGRSRSEETRNSMGVTPTSS